LSSLIAHIDENQVLVATDTLATSPDGNPLMFTTKAFIVPHLRMIIAGTGVGGFLDRWFVRINNNLIVRGIDNLNYHTPRHLTAIWDGFEKEFPFSGERTTTVYHFGFSEVTGLIHSYVYGSTNNFQPKALKYGAAVKPECTVPNDYNFPEDIKTLMNEQRAIQSLRPKEQRVHIGGEIQVHHLMKSGFNVFTLAEFEDRDKDEKAIYENFQKRASLEQT
jgi:hypothetical protein